MQSTTRARLALCRDAAIDMDDAGDSTPVVRRVIEETGQILADVATYFTRATEFTTPEEQKEMLTVAHQLSLLEAEKIKAAVLDAARTRASAVDRSLDPEQLARGLIAAFAAVDAATCPSASTAD